MRQVERFTSKIHKLLGSVCSDLSLVIFVWVQLYSTTLSPVRVPPFPPASPHLNTMESATQGHAWDRDSGAAEGNPQEKRQLQVRQTFSGRSARVAARPESQAAPARPTNSIFRDWIVTSHRVLRVANTQQWVQLNLSPPSHDSVVTTSTPGPGERI